MRAPVHAWAAVAPLVLLHAAACAIFEPPVQAAAAVWVLRPLLRAGLGPASSALVVAAILVALGVALSARALRRGTVRFRPGLVPLIWLEGAAWGLVLDVGWNGLGARAPGGLGLGPGDEIVLALGAGIYEELVFRVGVFHAVRAVALRLAGQGATGRATAAAVVVTSLAFAAAHHLGPEPFALGAFAFRVVAAVFFTALLATRGLGVAVAAHVAYDLALGLGLP